MHNDDRTIEGNSKVEMGRDSMSTIADILGTDLRIAMASDAPCPFPTAIFSKADIAQKATLQ
jgi:hypothetical protein